MHAIDRQPLDPQRLARPAAAFPARLILRRGRLLPRGKHLLDGGDSRDRLLAPGPGECDSTCKAAVDVDRAAAHPADDAALALDYRPIQHAREDHAAGSVVFLKDAYDLQVKRLYPRPAEHRFRGCALAGPHLPQGIDRAAALADRN